MDEKQLILKNTDKYRDILIISRKISDEYFRQRAYEIFDKKPGKDKLQPLLSSFRQKIEDSGLSEVSALAQYRDRETAIFCRDLYLALLRGDKHFR